MSDDGKKVFSGAELEELLGAGNSTRPPESARIERERIFIRPTKVSLSLTTFPSGAYVVFDRRGRGHSPLSLKDLKPGRHLVEIYKPGYTVQRVPLDLATDQRMSIKLRKGRASGPRLIRMAREKSSPLQTSHVDAKTHRTPVKAANDRRMAGLIRDPLGTDRITKFNTLSF